ncbi:MAG: 5-aminolevulinate synthase [Candidatus Nucleicultricaceae bacterium]
MDYSTFFDNALQGLKAEGRYRYFLDIKRLCGDFPYALYQKGEVSQKIVVWCGNDYLGMGQHREVVHAMHTAIDAFGVGSGGTRNISGTTSAHVALEAEIAQLHQKESALVFTSGYVANEAALNTLASHLPNCVVLSDENNHASIIQGIRNSRAEKIIFRHNDVDHLCQILERLPRERPKIVVFESIYSMDGDIGRIKEICALAREFNALTYLDEVHGVGMYGPTGAGVAEAQGLQDEVDIIQGTLGKAFGLIGGYVAGNRRLIDFIRSFASGFIFTTSLPPAICAAATASIHHLRNHSELRERHQRNVALVKEKLRRHSIPIMENESHIVPVMVKGAARCKSIADRLLDDHNIYVQPINYPTVPKGYERLRVTPSALHTEAMIDQLVEALQRIFHLDDRVAA